MRWKGWRWIAAMLSAIAAPGDDGQGTAQAEFPFWSRAKTCNQGAIRAYNYADDATVESISILFRDRIGEPRVIPSGTGARGGTDAVRVRDYFADRRQFEVDGLHVDEVAISLLDSGELAASCQLYFDGKTERALNGSTVTLRLQARLGRLSSGRLDSSRPVIWESAHELWIPTGQFKTVMIPRHSGFLSVHNRPQQILFANRCDDHDLSAVHLGVSHIGERTVVIPKLQENFDEVVVFQLIVQRHKDT